MKRLGRSAQEVVDMDNGYGVPVALPPLPEASAGSYERSPRTYRSLHAFMAGDDRRAKSRERDLGLRWHEDVTGRTYRASWSELTGELYVVQHGSGADGGGHVEVLAVAESAAALERTLAGWQRRCGTTGSMAWLRAAARAMSSETGPGLSPG